MSFLNLFFGFKGRIKRSQYWLAAIAQFIFLIALVFGLVASLGMSGPELAAQREAMNPEVLAKVGMVGIALILGLLVNMWSAAAVYTKRLHDRNKGAIWLLAIYGPSLGSLVFPPLVFVSLISGLWVFIELGCMPGTNGPNRFDDGPSNAAYLDDVFGKAETPAPRGVGGMEAALAAINAAARDRGAQAPAPRQGPQYGRSDETPQFGKRAAPAYGTFNAMPNAGGGFGRKV